LPDLSAERIYALFGGNARRIFNLDPSVIEKGSLCNLTLFDMEFDWTYDLAKTVSKSRNSPFYGIPLKGKAIGIVAKGKLHLSN
jgi:dihydroorotase